MKNDVTIAGAPMRVLCRSAAFCMFLTSAQVSVPPVVPRFIELQCGADWGSFDSLPPGTARCGTISVPQNRATPNDSRLLAVVLPVIVYTMPGAKGTPMVFLAGGPGESSIEAVQRVFLRTPIGQLTLRERPIIVFDRRGYSPRAGRASPDLGTVTYEPRAKRELAIAPVRDSLVSYAKRLHSTGVEPRNFSTAASVEDIADVIRALHNEKVILFAASYGTREALRFMHQYPSMVETVVLDGVAPPNATQVLDAAYVASSGREVIGRILADCKLDPVCATQYADLGDAIASLSRDTTGLRRTARFSVPGSEWRTLQVKGASILSVLGVAAAHEEVRASVPRMIVDLAGHDTVRDELMAQVLLGAALDPSLQTAARRVVPLVYYVALCGDRPQGEPTGGDRRLCDALGVPFGGDSVIAPVTSKIPVLLMSSGYDAQTPAELADEAAKTLPNSKRVSFATAGHVAFARPTVSACAALIVDAFLRHPEASPVSDCIGIVTPAFLPRNDGQSKTAPAPAPAPSP
jgi:pimeloyl-ACP methyl ester carboxylesterase